MQERRIEKEIEGLSKEETESLIAMERAVQMANVWFSMPKVLSDRSDLAGRAMREAAWVLADACSAAPKESRKAFRHKLLLDALLNDRDDVFEEAGRKGWLDPKDWDISWQKEACRQGAEKCALIAADHEGWKDAKKWEKKASETLSYENEDKLRLLLAKEHPLALLIASRKSSEQGVRRLAAKRGEKALLESRLWRRFLIEEATATESSAVLDWLTKNGIAEDKVDEEKCLEKIACLQYENPEGAKTLSDTIERQFVKWFFSSKQRDGSEMARYMLAQSVLDIRGKTNNWTYSYQNVLDDLECGAFDERLTCLIKGEMLGEKFLPASKETMAEIARDMSEALTKLKEKAVKLRHSLKEDEWATLEGSVLLVESACGTKKRLKNKL